MKKTTLGLLCASLLTVGLLTGCNNDTKEPAKWTVDQAEIFSSHLYSVVPPAVDGIKNIKVTFDEEEDMVAVSGKDSTADKLKAYAKKFKTSDGWVRQSLGQGYSNAYAFLKEVVLNNDDSRFVYTVFYATSSSGSYSSSGKGKFAMQLYDPYTYAWPGSDLLEMADYYGSTYVPPMIEADHYYVDFDSFNIQAYYESSSEGIDGGYRTILSDNSWVTRNELDSYGYLIANCPDGKYSVRYKYFEEDQVLDIWLDLAVFDSMPTNLIIATAQYYEDMGSQYFFIPSPTGESLLFSYEEDPYNMFYVWFEDYSSIGGYVYVDGMTLLEYEAYIGLLEENLWEVEEDELGYSDYVVSKVQDDYIDMFELAYEDGILTIHIYLVSNHLPYTEWPTDLVNALVPGFVNDSIPAFVGDNAGFEMYGTGVRILLDPLSETTPEQSLNNYIAILVANDYTEYEGDDDEILYASLNSEILIKLVLDEDGDYLDLYVSLLPYEHASPDAVINYWLTANGIATNVLPSVSVANAKWDIDYSKSYTSLVAEGDYSESVALSYFTDFVAALDATFEMTYEYNEYDKIYSSTTYGFAVNPYVTGDGLFAIVLSTL